eukprot:15328755-Ditylum_brightwellii.AAC.1
MYNSSTTQSSDDQYLDSAASTCTATSTRNASLFTLEVYQLEAEETSYNYRGPKVVIKNEISATICTANTIEHLQSRKLLKVLLKKSFSTLAGTLDTQQMVTLQDVCPPEFDKNRHISQQHAM